MEEEKGKEKEKENRGNMNRKKNKKNKRKMLKKARGRRVGQEGDTPPRRTPQLETNNLSPDGGNSPSGYAMPSWLMLR